MSKSKKIDEKLFLERYLRWRAVHVPESGVSKERVHAWHLYCDARDGLPDGTSAAKAGLKNSEAAQMSLFGVKKVH